jgi:hypothetical protein
VLQGLLPIDKACIAPDIIAGITLGALGIPEVMGYTKIIGTPMMSVVVTGARRCAPFRTTIWVFLTRSGLSKATTK